MGWMIYVPPLEIPHRYAAVWKADITIEDNSWHLTPRELQIHDPPASLTTKNHVIMAAIAHMETPQQSQWALQAEWMCVSYTIKSAPTPSEYLGWMCNQILLDPPLLILTAAKGGER